MILILLYYCGTEEICKLSLPDTKEIKKKKSIFALKSLQSDHKVSDSRWTQKELFSVLSSGNDTRMSVFKLFLAIMKFRG